MRLYLAVFALILLFAVACGSRHSDSDATFLQQQLIELDRLVQPQGVDPAKWADLKSSLRAMIVERIASGRTSSSAPSSNGSQAQLSFDSGTGALSWGYYNVGDYDQNSEVNVADLSALGAHLLEQVPADPNSALAVIDGDSNGEINVADLTPLGANLGSRVSAYNVYSSQDAGDYPATNTAPSAFIPIGTLQFAAATGDKTTQRLQFAFSVPSPAAGDIYWVRPEDGSGDGTPSNIAGPGAPLESSIQLYQASFEYPNGTDYPDTSWGDLELTFRGTADLLYLNFTYEGNPALVNVPILSSGGVGVMQSVHLPFSLHNIEGEAVTSATVSYSLDSAPKSSSAARKVSADEPLAVLPKLFGDVPENGASHFTDPPVPGIDNFGFAPDFTATVYDSAVNTANFPNQPCGYGERTATAISNSLTYLAEHFSLPIGPATDKPTSIAAMKTAVDSDPNFGASQNWVGKKDDYMKEHAYPIKTKTAFAAQEVLAAVRAGYDVEMITTLESVGFTFNQQTTCVVGVALDTTGLVTIQTVEDTKPGQLGGEETRVERLAIRVADSGEWSWLEPLGNKYPALKKTCGFAIEYPDNGPEWESRRVYGDQYQGVSASALSLETQIALAHLNSFAFPTQVSFGTLDTQFLEPLEPIIFSGPSTSSFGPAIKIIARQDGSLGALVQDDTPFDDKLFLYGWGDSGGDDFDQTSEVLIDSSGAEDFSDFDVFIDDLGDANLLYLKGSAVYVTKSIDSSVTSFFPGSLVPFSFALHCAAASDGVGNVCAWSGSGSVKVARDMDFTTGVAAGQVEVGGPDVYNFSRLWIWKNPNPGGGYDLMYGSTTSGLQFTSSYDGGQTWSPPATVDPAATAARGMAVTYLDGGGGKLFPGAAYYQDNKLLFGRALDEFGINWSPPIDLATLANTPSISSQIAIIPDPEDPQDPIIFAQDENVTPGMSAYYLR